MERQVFKKLLDWKRRGCKKPLVLNGARQVGKTWLLQKLASQEFENFIYVSLDQDQAARVLFEQGSNVESVAELLCAQRNISANVEDILFIFDEIQTCPEAITYLKYFNESDTDYKVAAAGSLLGLSTQYGSGWPVGKVETCNVYPLNFREFLSSLDKTAYVKFMEEEKYDIIRGLSSELKEIYRNYLVVGGMPDAVATFLEEKDMQAVRRLQNQILEDYERDFAKHADANLLKKLFEIWSSIPQHLARENKKFVFGKVRKGSRAKDYEEGLQWLEHAGLISRCYRIKKPSIPLKAYADAKCFKVFGLDVGLLGAMAGLTPDSILSRSSMFEEFKGAMTEQYVCSEFVSYGITPYYWSAENSSGEVDFLVEDNEYVYAIEVKSEENLKSKSLRAFKNKYDSIKALRISNSDYREQDWMKNIPLYMI